MLLFHLCTMNNDTFRSHCVWMATFMTMALCPVCPICVSLLCMLYKWQSSYTYCISFVCFYKTRWTVQTEGGGDTAALVIWNLQWPVLITAILFVEGSRIYTGFNINLNILCFSNEYCVGGTYVNEAISATKAIQHQTRRQNDWFIIN
jgi:hypothetical protein